MKKFATFFGISLILILAVVALYAAKARCSECNGTGKLCNQCNQSIPRTAGPSFYHCNKSNIAMDCYICGGSGAVEVEKNQCD